MPYDRANCHWGIGDLPMMLLFDSMVGIPLFGVLFGMIGSLLMLFVLVVFRASLDPLFVVASYGWPRDIDEVTFAQAITGFILVGGFGGLVFVLLVPPAVDHHLFGIPPFGGVAMVVAGTLFLLYAVVGGRLKRDDPEQLQERLAWFAAAIVYAVCLIVGVGFLTGWAV